MGGGGPRPHAGKRSPRPPRRGPRRWAARAAERRAGTRAGKVGFGSVSLYRLGGAPIRADARVAGRAGSRGPSAAGRARRRAPLAGSHPAPRPGLSRSASPSSARSLPEPGLIWSRWRQGVAAAQPPLLGCQYPAHSLARPPARSFTRALARAAAAAAARPGILSKFRAQLARARRSAAPAGGQRRGAARATAPSPQPHAQTVPGKRKSTPAFRLSQPCR